MSLFTTRNLLWPEFSGDWGGGLKNHNNWRGLIKLSNECKVMHVLRGYVGFVEEVYFGLSV